MPLKYKRSQGFTSSSLTKAKCQQLIGHFGFLFDRSLCIVDPRFNVTRGCALLHHQVQIGRILFAAGYLNRVQCRQSVDRMRALFFQLPQFILSLIELNKRLLLQGVIAAKVID